MPMPSRAGLLVAAVPFAAACFSVPLWDRVRPFVFGLPFNMFWLIAWTVLSSACLWLVYRLEKRHGAGHGSGEGGRE